MRNFLLFAAAAALAASPALASAQAPKAPARAKSDLSAYVSIDDYPPSAIRHREQGTVRFRLDVGAQGRVTACTVVSSSGSAILDATTCRILRARARFTPATDGAGNPVADSVDGAIHWILPPDPLPTAAGGTADPAAAPPVAEPPDGPPRAGANLASYVSNDDYPAEAIRNGEQGTVRFRLTVGIDGRVSSCAIVESSGSASLDSTTCRILTERARFTPATDAEGRPVPDTVTNAIRWVIPERVDHPEIGEAIGAWAECIEARPAPSIPNRAPTVRETAEAAFPACLAEEDKLAALFRAEAPEDTRTKEEARREMRESMIDYLEREREAPQP
jgi:TonB family protein